MKSMHTRFLRFLLFAGIGLIHGIVPAIAPYSSVNATDEMRIQAACFALVGTLALSLGWAFVERMLLRKTHSLPTAAQILRQPHLRRRLEYLFFSAAVIGAVAWPAYIYALGSTFGEYAEESRFAFRGSGNALLTWVLSGLMNLAFLPGFLGFFLSPRHRLMGVAYAIAYAAMFYLVSSGTRGFPIGLLGAVLSGYVLHRPQSFSRLFWMGCSVGAMVFLMVGLLPLRWQMANLTLPEMGELLISPETYEDMLVRDPLNYHEYLVEVMSYFPEYHDYVDGASYRRILFFYLPHSQFPDLKPKDPNRIVAQLLFDTDLDMDWMHPPSIFGDAFINFEGWYGLIHLVLVGALLAWLSKTIHVHLLWLMVLAPNLVYFTFIGMRGQPYTLAINTLTMTVYVGLVMVKLGLPLRGIERIVTRHQVLTSGRRKVQARRSQAKPRSARQLPQPYKLAPANRPNRRRTRP